MRWLVAVLAIGGLTAGCAGGSGGSPLPARAEVQPRVHTLSGAPRTQVHELLGEPWLASERYGVEVFRGKDAELPARLMYLRAPIKEAGRGYTSATYVLVSYDPAGRVAAADAVVARGELARFSGAVSLRSDNVEFRVCQRRELLLVSAAHYLGSRKEHGPSTHCTVLIGCGESGVCWNRFQLDGGAIQVLPLEWFDVSKWEVADARAPTAGRSVDDGTACEAGSATDLTGKCMPGTERQRALVPVVLTAGRHMMTFTRQEVAGEAKAELECVPGEVYYALLGGQLVEGYWPSPKFWTRVGTAVGTVDFYTRPPAALDRLGVVVNVDGTWLGGSR